MPLYLTKLLPQFIYPLSISLWLSILSFLLILRRKKTAAGLLLASIAILWISSTPVCSSYLIASLEKKSPPVPIAESPKADRIVVLGGAVSTVNYPKIKVGITDSSNRILHAARLFRAGKAPKIITSGGSIPWMGSSVPEACAVTDLLCEWGVPADAVIQEPESLNTYQNAVNTKRLFDKQGLKSILLVTSAFHMPRALATFRAAGIHAIPSPTGFHINNEKKITLLDILPDAGALNGTTLAMKEYLGCVVYRIRGWL